jgi:DNA/RNA-binding domain of Phe-tRNA-synthetase-like protein
VNGSRSTWLDGVVVDDDIALRYPTYGVVLVGVFGADIDALRPVVDDLVERANAVAAEWTPDTPTAAFDHLERWHEVYRSFGANPRRTRVSVEALLRRAAQSGLPRIGPLVDVYNAISIIHCVPIGGEDLAHYQGPARLHLATGDEPFHAMSNGEAIIEHPDHGEPVWSDDLGVTCRRWNWRQTNRTAITDATVDAGFIIDSLHAPDHAGARAAAAHLGHVLQPIARSVEFSFRPAPTTC